MSVGALIAAYQEDDVGALRALLPLAGKTLIEFQVRCAAAAGASPIVIMVERVPAALHEAIERLRLDGIAAVPVSAGDEAASRFDAGSLVLLIGDGVVAPLELLVQMVAERDSIVATVPDTEAHHAFERIDADSRWAGVAVVQASTIGATAAMLGDWDLQSTLLRKTLQDGAARFSAADHAHPLVAERAEQLASFEGQLIALSRGPRRSWASRYVLPLVEEFATVRLMETGVRPGVLLWIALALTLGAAVAFTRGWLLAGATMLVLSTPLDLVARRLAILHLRPLSERSFVRRALWPAAALALLSLGWRLSGGQAGWTPFVTAVAAAAFAEAGRIERGAGDLPGQIWLFSRRNAILAVVPFAIAGAWVTYLVALALYAAGSFFFVQHLHHRLTTN
jgi:hypothetical protein